jgi:hypothetical protein
VGLRIKRGCEGEADFASDCNILMLVIYFTLTFPTHLIGKIPKKASGGKRISAGNWMS